LLRPAEVNILQGDASKARAKLGWRHAAGFNSLVREMVEADCRALGIELKQPCATAAHGRP
jgi:GDPmannose 4,6-dehydratase